LKNDDYVNYKHYFVPDVALMIRATVNEWSPREEPNKKVYSLKIKMVYMLADVRDKLVKSVDITLDIDKVSNELVESFERYTVNTNGKILKFRINDPESNLQLNLFSRNKHVLLTDEFVTFLRDNPRFEFRLA
jgi:DNA polymerase-3 subunit alpha